MTTPNQQHEAPAHIRLVKREGRFANEWYYPDAAVMPFEQEYHYARVDPPVAPECVKCGHNNFENRRGYCVERVPQHLGRALCGCKCEFSAAPAAPAERDRALAEKFCLYEYQCQRHEAIEIIAHALATVRQEVEWETWEKASLTVRQLGLRSEKHPNRYLTAAAFKTRVECALESAAKQEST